MTQKAKSILVGLAGLLAGAALTVNLSAIADKDAETALPVEELRAFTDVFARIKNDYVEPVEDKKLITEAINGMLTGLDPHSSYLDVEAFKECGSKPGELTGHRFESSAALFASDLASDLEDLFRIRGRFNLLEGRKPESSPSARSAHDVRPRRSWSNHRAGRARRQPMVHRV